MADIEAASIGSEAKPELSASATAVSNPLFYGRHREDEERLAPGASREDVNTSVPGWPALARIVARNPELEAFPSFSDLAIKSLLYYQAELIYLRKKLHDAEWKDYFDGGPIESRFAETLDILFRARESDRVPEQWVILERIRAVLEKYNLALLQHSKISGFTKADDGDVEVLKRIAKQISSIGSPITGSGSATWGSLNATAGSKPFSSLLWDFVSSIFISRDLERKPVPREFQEKLVLPREGFKPPDSVTLWILHNFIPLYGYIWKRLGEPQFPSLRRLWRLCLPIHTPQITDEKNALIKDRAGNFKKTHYFSGSGILRLTFIAITVVVCLLPTVAIVILAQVNSKGLVLRLITAFTAIFAFGLIFFSSSASREDVFIATIGFSAVMVVFVQSQLTPP